MKQLSLSVIGRSTMVTICFVWINVSHGINGILNWFVSIALVSGVFASYLIVTDKKIEVALNIDL